jgi:hypothetical protein
VANLQDGEPPDGPVILAPSRPQERSVSFFDDEPDEPTRVSRPARPRRAAPSGRTAGAPDPDTVRFRRMVAFGVLAIIAILLIVFVRSCSNTRHKNALKDYNRDVTSIVQDSDQQVGKQLFQVLSSGGQPQDVSVAVSQVRLAAEQDVKRAKALSVPDEMKDAQRNLELVLNLRKDAVTKINGLVNKALSPGGAAPQALRAIAGNMQQFLASDVIYSQRVNPLIRQGLQSKKLGDQPVATSHFLPTLAWLDPAAVAARLNPDANVGGGGTTTTGGIKPGTHGHGLVGVKAGNVTLQPGGVTNHVPATAPLPVEVTLANQGENDETNVRVVVKITGGAKAITGQKVLNVTKAGTNSAVIVQLSSVPPKNSARKMTVTIQKVPGEKTLDNNTQTYTVLFQ